MKPKELVVTPYFDSMQREMVKQWNGANHDDFNQFVDDSILNVYEACRQFVNSDGGPDIGERIHRLAVAASFLDMFIHIQSNRNGKKKARK